MSYVSLDKNSDIILLEPRVGWGTVSPVGELLFSFLDLDLKEYRNLYYLIGYDCDFEYDDFKALCKKYPKTCNKMSKSNWWHLTEDADTDMLRSFALCFLTENEDTFSELYEHSFFSLSDTVILARHIDFDEAFAKIDFFRLQETFKNLIDFCFINDNPKLTKLNKMDRFFLFLASEPKFNHSFGTFETFFPRPNQFFTELEASITARIREVDNDNYRALKALSLLDDSIIDKIKNKSDLVRVASCYSIFDFLAFEFKTILSKDIDIKRCVNCGKLFIPSGKYNTDCCDRIPEGEKYSCKKIMAQKRRKQKVNSDPITKEYEKAYKRMYARISSGTLEKSDFLKWSEDAKQKRDAASQRYAKSKDETIIIDFKKYLGNK